MAIVLSRPSYGPVEPSADTSIMNAIMFASNRGVKWAGTANPDRQAWSEARNVPIRQTRGDSDVTGILWVDADMRVPPEAFMKLLDTGHDLVSGLYFQREPPYWPNAYKLDVSTMKFRKVKDYPEGVIAPYFAFGFGICYTSAKVINALPEDPFNFGELSEDIGFCKMAFQKGFIPHVDFGLQCRHLHGPHWVGERDFKRFRKILMEVDDGGLHDAEQEGVRGVHSDPEGREVRPVAGAV